MNNDNQSFRIVTNGRLFKIQKRGVSGWWLWKRECWTDIGKLSQKPPFWFITTYYTTLKEAEEKMDNLIKYEKALHEMVRSLYRTINHREHKQ